MKNMLYGLLAKIFRVNFQSTPTDVIVDQMLEPRPLPMGRKEFAEWSARIIAGAMIPGGEDDIMAFYEGQQFSLANMILHLGPTESHKPDAFFIHSLRKVAVNQVADVMRRELHEAGKTRTSAKEEADKAAQQVIDGIEAVAAATLARAGDAHLS